MATDWIKTEFDRHMHTLAHQGNQQVRVIMDDGHTVTATLIGWQHSRARVRFGRGSEASVKRDRTILPAHLEAMRGEG